FRSRANPRTPPVARTAFRAANPAEVREHHPAVAHLEPRTQTLKSGLFVTIERSERGARDPASHLEARAVPVGLRRLMSWKVRRSAFAQSSAERRCGARSAQPTNRRPPAGSGDRA